MTASARSSLVQAAFKPRCALTIARSSSTYFLFATRRFRTHFTLHAARTTRTHTEGNGQRVFEKSCSRRARAAPRIHQTRVVCTCVRMARAASEITQTHRSALGVRGARWVRFSTSPDGRPELSLSTRSLTRSLMRVKGNESERQRARAIETRLRQPDIC